MLRRGTVPPRTTCRHVPEQAWKEGIGSGKPCTRRLNRPSLFSHRAPARYLQLLPADPLVWLLVCRLWQEAPGRF